MSALLNKIEFERLNQISDSVRLFEYEVENPHFKDNNVVVTACNFW